MPVDVVVVGAEPVVVVPGDAGAVVTAAVVVAAVTGGAGAGVMETPIEVVSGPLPAHGLAAGIAKFAAAAFTYRGFPIVLAEVEKPFGPSTPPRLS